ncbi:uncharacterized protein STEHIDRAFT_121799 [Stereum hirsutum FP-91666 SS1]|uniref:uncharacterized protein n=1 Tax=Stereum hirsutum (strain FP-91666) TaxID=721885 RepID=UPI0004449AAD|nr:uncharacterized protein STEHIDRAFT_121799 [Stereum hirsutum FP-91666 SS1]EIM85764.1 hypothetical protein STEHIDRAFT_121799 [Stereum hirsutum FP-91666 SS1]
MDPSTETTGNSLPPPTVPMRNSRTLVLCFDGTADQYDAENTNVVRLFSLLQKGNNSSQLVYYQPGVGTYLEPGVVSPLFTWGAKVLDEAVAWYLPQHVIGGYTYLMSNYSVGDKICLFGFSRGAYTARALAGMLRAVGLLPRDNSEQAGFAFRLYSSEKLSDQQLVPGFKRTYCRDVTVEFLGVWDTVESVGIIMTKSLPFVSTNDSIRTFRHALSLDQHRAKFRPSLYHRPTPQTAMTAAAEATSKDTKKEHRRPFLDVGFRRRPRQSLGDKERILQPPASEQHEDAANTVKRPDFVTDSKEVWFAGCHADVGGGAVPDGTKYSLADITLRWMVREIMLSQCGIIFEDDALERLNIPLTVMHSMGSTGGGPQIPDAGILPAPVPQEISEPYVVAGASDAESQSRQPLQTSRSGRDLFVPGSGPSRSPSPNPWKAREITDMKQPLHDEMKRNILWWLLEIIPTKATWQDVQGNWHSSWSLHCGRGRYVPPNSLFHSSVKLRMDDEAMNYKPKAVYQAETIKFVD